MSLCSRFCLPQNRGLCIFDEAFLFRYNRSTNQKEDCIWKFSTFALETTISHYGYEHLGYSFASIHHFTLRGNFLYSGYLRSVHTVSQKE